MAGCVRCVFRLTDEVGLASVDGVLKLIGGDAEFIFRGPVHCNGVM